MAPPPLLPGTFKCAFGWTFGGQVAVNVMHFNGADETTLFAQLTASVTAGMWAAQVTGSRISTVTITHLDNLSATQEFATTGAQWAGSSIGTDMDPAIATLVSFKTGFRGLGSDGRVYLPFTDSALTSNGILTQAPEDTAQAAWNTFRTSMSSSGSPLQVTSYGIYVKGDPGPPQEWLQVEPPITRGVTTINVRAALGTQRRRQRRVQAGTATILALRDLTAQLARSRD